jgi:phage terminase small subunit
MGGKGSGGKNRKSAAKKKAEGNRGKRTSTVLQMNAPVAKPGEPKMPSFLTVDQREVWKGLIPILRDNGVLTDDCGIALGALCSGYVLFTKVENEIFMHEAAVRGLEAKIEAIIKRRTVCARRRSDALRHLRSSWQAFGLDPSSRAGMIGIARIPTTEESALDKIMQGDHDDVVN